MKVRVLGVLAVSLVAAIVLAQPVKQADGQPSTIPPDPNRIPISPEPRRPLELQPSRGARSAKVIAIKLHADWCPLCQGMGTLFEDLGKKFDADPVLFVRMDLTDQRGRVQGEYLAAAIGVGGLWKELGEGKKTGEVVLVEVGSKKIVGRIAGDAGWEKAEKAMGEVVKK